MSTAFLFWVALICIAAMAPILWPLLRPAADDATASERPSRLLALALVVLVPLAAMLQYREIGEPRALDPKALISVESEMAAAPDLATAVAGLERRLAGQPDDVEGLRLLARGYQQLQQFGDARDTLAKVRALRSDDLDVQVEYAEAIALASDTRRIDGEAESLLTDALSKDPNHQRALWLSGIAAVQRDDKATALSHWQHLLPLLPPESTVYNAVADQIRGIGGEVTAAVTHADTSAAAIAPVIRIQVSIAAALQQRVAATDTVYVFARAAEGPKMPLAIQRFAASELPKEVMLDDSSGMMPTLKLSQTPRIVLGARISKSGNAIPQSGDLEVISSPIEQSAITAPVALEIADVVP